MKLYENLPDEVRVGRRKYRVDLDFRNVIRMMEILQDDTLITGAREYRAARCVMKHPRKGALEAVKKLIFQGGKPGEDHKRVTSFDQDAGMIRAAFLQAYGIDLWTARMHWLQFFELLQNLPEDTRYINVIGIRGRPMPKATKYNQEEREWLQKQKRLLALKETPQEQERNYQRDVANIFQGLAGMIPKG